MHVRDPKVQRSDFITSSLLHNEHPKFSLFKLDKHIILGVTNNLRFLGYQVHFFSSGSLQSARLIFNGDNKLGNTGWKH